MKQLQLTPPLLIITMGYPGAGKTFFARQFADLYSLPCISEDRFRYELFEKPLFNNDEQEIIGSVLRYSLEQAMKTKSPIVCDGSYSTLAHRTGLYTLARNNGYRTLTVWVQTDVRTSAHRAQQRDRRNPDSKYSFNIDPKTMQRLQSSLQRPTEKEVSIVISGKNAFKGQNLTVLRKIADMYTAALSLDTPPSSANQKPLLSRRVIQ